jgi:hypothetical protein
MVATDPGTVLAPSGGSLLQTVLDVYGLERRTQAVTQLNQQMQ